MTTPRPIDQIADAYVDDYVRLDPVTATYVGIFDHDDELTDYSPDGYQARRDLNRRTLAAIDHAKPVDGRERVAAAAMQERLGLEVELVDAGLASALNVIASPMQEIRQVFDLMSTDDDAAWRNVAARLAKVPAALDAYRTTLLEDVARGNRPAQRQVAACVEMARGWVAGDLFGALVRQYGSAGDPSVDARSTDARSTDARSTDTRSTDTRSDAALRSDLEAGARAATEAYEAFAKFLEGDLAPQARTTDGVGAERYALASRYFLGAKIDLDETYDWGWEELARLKSEMAEVARQLVASGDVAEAMQALDADPARRINGKEAFRDWMQGLADRAIELLAGTHFDIPEPIRRLECRIAPTQDGGIYYTGPSEDFSRPGRMWWSVPKGVDSFETWKEVTTVYHEGVPGHHLQVAQTVYRADLLNRWQRLLCWVSGHGEGWALYAERLMADLGFLDDPGDRMGMLSAQLFRAARVVVDLGLHLDKRIPAGAGFHDGEVWTPDVAYDFLRNHSTLDPATLRFELNRYLGWPGQAPSYKLGERIWLQARENVRARRGADFDLKEFHRDALNLGSLGLDPLRDALLAND